MREEATSEAPVLEAKDLFVGYSGHAVLENLNFSLRHGEIVALLGGSGCGKSTLMRTLIGLLPPVSGSVHLLGEEFSSAEAPAEEREDSSLLQRLGVMFQGGALFGSLSLLENVLFPLKKYTSWDPAFAERIARVKLDQVGLAAYADYKPKEISGGMQKRAAIARALALDPEILFLDEPSAGLDPITSASLDELILKLRADLGTTVVLVSHELPSINTVADRAVFLDRASRSILDSGSPRYLSEQSPHAAVRAFFARKELPR